MEVYDEEQSQSRRSSIKRPWEDDTTSPERGSGWYSASLPPIDTSTSRRRSLQEEPYERPKGPRRNEPEPKESVSKKAKYEGYDYNTFLRQNTVSNGKVSQARFSNSIYSQQRGSREAPTNPHVLNESAGPTNLHPSSDGPADLHEQSNLCRRCRTLSILTRDSTTTGEPDGCESCSRNPELQWISQECGIMLTQLADTLASGTTSDQRRHIRGGDQYRESADCPPIETYGVKQSLHWVLGRLHHINQLADKLVRQVPAEFLQNPSQDSSHDNGTKTRGGPVDIMKRRIGVDLDDLDDADPSSDARAPHIRRRSGTTSMLAKEELPPLRSQPTHFLSLSSADGSVHRNSGMNPPPAPNRQLLSPGSGRSLPSPTSLGFSSPSTPSYGVKTHIVNLPPPSNLNQQSSSNYLPPITSARSPDSALRDHTAVLQHEVSVQKIALSSLQGEHDKLLAAFSRSQTRASALEKKHAVSDTEIISLTEEKLRLQAQVVDLEREVEELARSRDGFRQAAVQEGAQYVEIVQKASRLEEIAGEERKNWGKLRENMERTITALETGRNSRGDGAHDNEDVPPASRADEIGMDENSSYEELVAEVKTEATNDPQPSVPPPETSGPSETQVSVEDLKAEILRLRERCADVETTLRAIREDSRSMEDIVKSLVERADSTLRG